MTGESLEKANSRRVRATVVEARTATMKVYVVTAKFGETKGFGGTASVVT